MPIDQLSKYPIVPEVPAPTGIDNLDEEVVEEEEPVEEEVKPEGFMSKVRGLFGRFKKKDK